MPFVTEKLVKKFGVEYEWLEGYPLLPPYLKRLVPITHFYKRSKGRLIRCEIVSRPENPDKLQEWVKAREEMNKPVLIGVCYLVQLKQWALVIQVHEDTPPVFITIDDLSLYTKRTALTKSSNLNIALRFITYYCGYTVKEKSLGKAEFKPKLKVKQIDLLSVVNSHE